MSLIVGYGGMSGYRHPGKEGFKMATYDTESGEWRPSTDAEIQALKEWCGLTDEEKEIRISGLTEPRIAQQMALAKTKGETIL